jgi:hypothetical protein
MSGAAYSAPQLQDHTRRMQLPVNTDRAVAVREKFEKKSWMESRNYPQLWIILVSQRQPIVKKNINRNMNRCGSISSENFRFSREFLLDNFASKNLQSRLIAPPLVTESC